jgi:signal transduction histidine kinase
MKLVLVLAAVTVVVCVFGGYIYFHAGAVLAEDTEEDLVTTAETQAQHLDEWLVRMEVQMFALSDAGAFQSDDMDRIAVQLWEVVERDDDVEAAYYIDTKSDQVITSTGNAKILSAEGVLTGSEQQNLTAVATGDDDTVSLTRPFRPHPESAPVVVFATGVHGRDDRAIITVVNLDSLSNSKLTHATNANVVVRNDEGIVVLSEDTDRILADDPLANSTKTGGFALARSDGEQLAVGVAALSTRDWVVTARESTAQAYALQTDISRQILGILLVVVLGATGIFLTLGRSNIQSVRTLSTKARALQTGDLDVRVSTTREDEFGTLYEAFDTMRGSLKRQIEEAERARDEARTARLESERLREHLETKAASHAETMAACANGDLDERLDPASESDAMATIGRAFNDMMDDVQAQNEQLGAIARILSHDLRNPLNVASGQAELVADRTGDDAAKIVVEELDRMTAIIDDALVLARGDIEASTLVHLETCAQRAWRHVETDDATLIVQADHSVIADETLLTQAFENLFRNAVEHAGPETSVRVGATPAGIYVADDGPGVPKSERESVFGVGYTTNRASGGSGFGLAIVSRISSAHGWTVQIVESEDGGARFEFSGVETTAKRPVTHE